MRHIDIDCDNYHLRKEVEFLNNQVSTMKETQSQYETLMTNKVNLLTRKVIELQLKT